MTTPDLQGWITLAVTLVLLIRTFIGDGRKGFEKLGAEIVAARAETNNVRAMLADFQLKVAQEYARNDRLDRIESKIDDLLAGHRRDR